MDHLAAAGCVVMRLADAESNSTGTGAPLIQIGNERLRAPDYQAIDAGVSSYWEVKYRSRPDINPDTGSPEYWMSYEAFVDYHRLRQISQVEVRVVLFDSSDWERGQRWLMATIGLIASTGRQESRAASDGGEVNAWVWSAECMEIIPGPQVDLSGAYVPVFPTEGEEQPVSHEELIPFERDLRGESSSSSRVTGALPVSGSGVADVLRRDAQSSLDVLRRSLGIPQLPRYSVVRIGIAGIDIDGVIGLLDYGIRVFLITHERVQTQADDQRLKAFEEARLLEWAVVPDVGAEDLWIVDGRINDEDRVIADHFLEKADQAAGINLGQYQIVHADHSADVLVTAGAGTGKTETMAERIVYLLATSVVRSDPLEAKHLFDLRLDEIALVTFTRDSASEMRRRIARTLMLRQRLCSRCVLPATAWLMQLSSTDIDTIHGYSKKIVQRDGAAIGLVPGFSVSQQTLRFRRLVNEALSPRIELLFLNQMSTGVPPAHEFTKFTEQLWTTLSNNGLSPLSLSGRPPGSIVDWGSSDGLEGEIVELFRDAVAQVAAEYRQSCFDTQTIPISELVPGAIGVIDATKGELRRSPRYLFIDEFQDTDAEQMELVLSLRMNAGARLFMVGDAKQGVYRFRGAQGDAFSELRLQFGAHQLPTLEEFGLTRNFRSGGRLLDSFHKWFQSWGRAALLQYKDESRLRDAGLTDTSSRSAEIMNFARGTKASQVENELIGRVENWVKKHPRDTVAVLCRTNKDAKKFRESLREAGIPCELRVGGDFFLSSAVSEARVFIEAVLYPENDAAILEFCETRWLAGLVELIAPYELSEEDRNIWELGVPELLSWSERLSSFAPAGNFDRKDLDAIRFRLRYLGSLLMKSPTLAWLLQCSATLAPKGCRMPGDMDDVDIFRYGRCFDHLVSLLDAAFQDSAISPHKVLEWLRLQIATNRIEDEPDPINSEQAVQVTALTVHKAKGLEFDRVVIPVTSSPFSQSYGRSEIAIIPSQSGGARLAWRWKWSPNSEYSNVASAESALWKTEAKEQRREEARLLYVAMTRAKSELVIFVKARATGPAAQSGPNSWADLITVVS